jgi:hypothetical protein
MTETNPQRQRLHHKLLPNTASRTITGIIMQLTLTSICLANRATSTQCGAHLPRAQVPGSVDTPFRAVKAGLGYAPRFLRIFRGFGFSPFRRRVSSHPKCP